MPLRNRARLLVSQLTRRIPKVRGLGRCVLAVDQLMTSRRNSSSYEVESTVNGNCRMLLDLSSWEHKFAYYYGGLEPELIAAVQRHFSQGGVFYDVGASIGLYSIKFGLVCQQRGGYVRAIEPVPANVALLRANLVRNGLDDRAVCIDEFALADTEGVANMILCSEGTSGNAKIAEYGDVRVRTTTLDTIWKQHDREQISFIKIDTEGWDAKIIEGGRDAISTCRPNMLIEFNRERMHNHGIRLDWVWPFLTNKLGYRCYRIGYRGREIPLSDPAAFKNLLFVHPET